MMAPVDPISMILGTPSPIRQLPAMSPGASINATGFSDMLSAGLRHMDAKIANADKLMQAYALGESIPAHQVTIALEQARLAVDVAVQIRERLVEAYRDFMNMQF